MPCRDDYPEEPRRINGATIETLAAIACSALKYIEKNKLSTPFKAEHPSRQNTLQGRTL
jgi:hypothetical protein